MLPHRDRRGRIWSPRSPRGPLLQCNDPTSTLGTRMMQPASQTTEAAPRAVPEQAAAEPRVPAAIEAPRVERVSWFDRFKFGVLRWFMWWIVRAFSLKGLYLFGRFF